MLKTKYSFKLKKNSLKPKHIFSWNHNEALNIITIKTRFYNSFVFKHFSMIIKKDYRVYFVKVKNLSLKKLMIFLWSVVHCHLKKLLEVRQHKLFLKLFAFISRNQSKLKFQKIFLTLLFLPGKLICISVSWSVVVLKGMLVLRNLKNTMIIIFVENHHTE